MHDELEAIESMDHLDYGVDLGVTRSTKYTNRYSSRVLRTLSSFSCRSSTALFDISVSASSIPHV